MRDVNLSQNNQVSTEAAAISHIADDGSLIQGVLAQDLMTELMGVVPVLGGSKVTVGFSGTGAYCDKNLSYVNIPSLPSAKIVPMQIAQEIRGFAAHEAAHIAFTDPTVAIVDDNGNQNPLLHEIWNCIEDYMIERDWLELYPGAKKNFAATEIRCCRGYQELWTKDPDVARDLRRVGPVALTWMRAIHFGLGTQSSRECLQTLSGEFQRRVTGWFQDILDVESTQECLDLAKEIYEGINADPFDPLNMPQNPQNGPQGGGGQAGGGQGGQGGNGGSKGKGASSGAGSQGSGTYSGPKPVPTGSQLKQVLDDADLINKESYVNAKIDSSAQSGPQSGILGDADGFTIAQTTMNQIRSETSAISMHLRRALKAASKTRYKSGRQDGKIDSSKLAIATMGGLDYHRRKIKGEEIDTAMSILVDCSGSMDGAELNICQQMALALEGALCNSKVKHEILGFTTGSIDDADQAFQTMVQANQANNGDGHFRAINMYEFRAFGQTHTEALRSIGNMTRVGTGGTPTGDAILLAHDRLARRKEKRHVMLVLTDGASDDGEAVQKAVATLESCNVTVIGVGICSDHVKEEFANHVVINDIKDLPAVMMSKITGILLGDKGLVALNGLTAQQIRKTAA